MEDVKMQDMKMTTKLQGMKMQDMGLHDTKIEASIYKEMLATCVPRRRLHHDTGASTCR